MATIDGTVAQAFGTKGKADVVEIGVLMPASWADDLMEMSRRERKTVGQILRAMINRGLADDRSSVN